MSQLPEAHFCYGCIHGATGRCLHRKSNYRNMGIATRRVVNCRYKECPEKSLKEATKEFMRKSVIRDLKEDQPEEVPQENDLTKIVGKLEKTTGEPDIEATIKIDAMTSIDPFTGSGTTFDPDPNDDSSMVVGVAAEVKENAEGGVDLIVDVSKEAVELGKTLVEGGVEPVGITLTKELHKHAKKTAKTMIPKKSQPTTHVESQVEDGPLPGGPTPPTPDKMEEKKKGPTGVRLHPKGKPNDGGNGPTEEKGKLFLEDIVKDIEEKTELPKNAILRAGIETKPILASENCTEVLDLVEKVNGKITEPNRLEVDPKELFAGIGGLPFKEGTELGMFSEHKIDASDLVFCFSCNQEHPIAYFNPDGNVCLNCVQIELRRILSEIRQRFFDPSAADQELLDKVLKEERKDGERLSMLETLYIARDLLQSYSPLTQKEKVQMQPPEIVPAMSSPFLITCEDMEDRIQKLTWAQLQKIARKMEVPLNQPIDWIAAQVCARIKRCDECGQLKLGKA